MPIAPRAPPKAMRGKCERGHPFSTPGLRFHGVDRADVFNNIRVRASRCGECALNPPPSQHLPRRRPTPVPAQRHTLPEHFRSPTQPRRTPADRTTHSPPKTSAPPRSADARPPTARCIPRRPYNPFPAEGLRPSPHSDTPHPSTSVPPRSPDARPQAARCIPRRRPSPAPAALPCPPLRSASGTKKRHRTVHVRCRMSRSTVVAVGHLGW